MFLARGISRLSAAALLCAATSFCACGAASEYTRDRVGGDLSARSGSGSFRPGASIAKTDAGAAPAIPPGVNLQDGLSEDEAVALALWNNATFQVDLSTLGLVRADLLDAGMIRNPLLTLFLPMGPRQLEFTAALPLEALWQRPRRIAAAKLEVERVAHGLVQSGLDLIRDVKVAYAEVVLAQELERLARESLTLRRRVAAIAEARLRAGDISILEAGLAQVDARQGEEEVVRQTYAAVDARETLRGLTGFAAHDAGWTVPVSPPEARPPVDAEAAIKEALALRPDLRAAELAIEAAGARLGWEKAKIVTNLAAAAKGSDAEGEYVAGPGFSLEIPLFNQNQGPRARAHAEIEQAIWRYAAVRQRVVQEVRGARRQYAAAHETLAVLRGNVLPALDDNLRRTEKAYGDGEIAFLLVLETMRQRLDAGVREATMNANLRRAAAQLDRSIGRKLVQKKE